MQVRCVFARQQAPCIAFCTSFHWRPSSYTGAGSTAAPAVKVSSLYTQRVLSRIQHAEQDALEDELGLAAAAEEAEAVMLAVRRPGD